MIGALLGWWYGQGWHLQLTAVKRRWLRWADYFSFSTLIQTLFAPFRQIGAGSVRGSLEVQLRQWSDRTFSRAVGFVVRTLTLLVGTIVMLGVGLFTCLQLLG